MNSVWDSFVFIIRNAFYISLEMYFEIIMAIGSKAMLEIFVILSFT